MLTSPFARARRVAPPFGHTAGVRELLQTRLGRLRLALTGVTLGIIAFSFTPPGRAEDPSWPLSIVLNSTSPLLVVVLALSFSARYRFLRRDWVTLVVALATGFTAAAAGVAVDRHLDAADVMLDLEGLLLGLTVLALIWSALGRRRPS